MEIRRKKKIEFLADFVSCDFLEGNAVNLHGIADYEELPIHYDNYEDTFDGMLVFHDSQFHVHINLDRGNRFNSRRGRFTLAHELGHYLIDEHRIALKYGLINPHQSRIHLSANDVIEFEADYFASCLLMPGRLFKSSCASRPFSFELIDELSNIFHVSLMATILRFVDIGSREIMVVVSKEGIVKWFSKSADFFKMPFRFKVGKPLPPASLTISHGNTVNGDFRSDIGEVDTDTWFYNTYHIDYLFEQYHYSSMNDYTITLLWFK